MLKPVVPGAVREERCNRVRAFAKAGPPAYRERSSREDRGLRTDR